MRLSRPAMIVMLFLCAMFAIQATIWWRERQFIAGGYADFTTFYATGKILAQGHGDLLYDEPAQWRVQQEVAPGVPIRQASLPYVHAPYEALLFAPLSWLPYTYAYVVWDLLNLLVLLSLPSLLRPCFPALQQYPRWLWMLACVAFFPAFFTLFQGQDAILLLLLYSLAFASLRKNRDFVAGAWLALGLFRFHLVAPLILIVFLARRWKLVAGFALVAILLAGLSAAVVGWSNMIHYPYHVWQLEQHTGRSILPPRVTPTLRGLIEDTLTGWISRTSILALVALASVGMIVFASRMWNRASPAGPDRFDLAFALSLIVTALVGYHTFLYDLSLLLIPELIVLNRLSAQHPPPWRVWMHLSPVVALSFTPIYVVIWLRWQRANLLGLILIFWLGILWRETCQPSAFGRKQGQAT